jgi:D-arabinose 1-dehydrogenase-like Zn-dependent alcohol dehydrogenase
LANKPLSSTIQHAALVTSFTAPPTYTTFPDPTPGPGEQLVSVTAAALHQVEQSWGS